MKNEERATEVIKEEEGPNSDVEQAPINTTSPSEFRNFVPRATTKSHVPRAPFNLRNSGADGA